MNEAKLKELIVQEYKKCVKDAQYFLTRYCIIQHPVRGKIPFRLYDFQKSTLQDFQSHRYNIVLKGRQIGLSTLVAGYALWKMLFHSDQNILVIATKQDVAKNLVDKVNLMHNNIPVWLRGTLTEDNKLSMKFTNGSGIKAVSSSPDAGRSEALSLLILDEAAFIEKAEVIWGAASSTLSTGGDAIILSTPNGMGNFFHSKWRDAQENGSMNCITLDWRVHPERDQAWRDDQTKTLGETLSRQEHDADFITTGNTVVPGEVIEFYLNTYKQDPIEKTGFDRNFWIWEYPVPNKAYIVCADTARGDGNDYSAAHVLELETLTQVAEYKGKIGTKEFGNLLVKIATEYNDALLIPENANQGWSTVQQIIDRGYKNLFYMSNDMQVVDVQHQLYQGQITERKLVPGFTTSVKTRPLVISKIDLYMREKAVIIRSDRLLNELFTFIWHNGKAEAAEGYNDDLVMSFGLGLWVRDTALRLMIEQRELHKASLGSMSVVRPTAIHTARGNSRQNPWEMEVMGGKENLREWL